MIEEHVLKGLQILLVLKDELCENYPNSKPIFKSSWHKAKLLDVPVNFVENTGIFGGEEMPNKKHWIFMFAFFAATFTLFAS